VSNKESNIDFSPEQKKLLKEVFPTLNNMLVYLATWGEGDPPERAEEFYNDFMANDNIDKLEGLNYSVCALGDSSYVDFCEVGIKLDEKIANLGANRIHDRIDCDVDFQEIASTWTNEALNGLLAANGIEIAEENLNAEPAFDFAKFFGSTEYTPQAPFVAEIAEKAILNDTGSKKETYHFSISLEGSGLEYEVGDSLGVIPENDPEMIEEILSVLGLSGNEQVGGKALRDLLQFDYDINALTKPVIEAYGKIINSDKLTEIANSSDIGEYTYGREIIDMLNEFPAIKGGKTVNAEQLVSILRKIPPRLYSIASAQEGVGEEVHLTVAIVRYDSHGRSRKGVASTHLADRLSVGSKVKVYPKTNKNFRLPENSNTPVIMVGPGTGIAPFRAFMQKRASEKANGKNWLFFGDQHFLHDFLYQLEWQDYYKNGLLTKFDAAFSRDTPEKANYLRGDLAESLNVAIDGSVSEDDSQLTKFHGTYMQDDRDLRANRRKKFLDKAYSFMIRVRVAGGLCSPQQWLHMDYIADNYANGTIKLTTRQAFQFHGVIKNNLKKTMQEINSVCLDTVAACGDVNRNVMCNPNPHAGKHYPAAQKLAEDISDHLTPRTGAYHEIWLQDRDENGDLKLFETSKAIKETIAHREANPDADEEEPIYGKLYLPRKFKTVIAVPPSNDVDIFAHCLGYIAIIDENDELIGWNVTVGGGMGMTHGDENTFPRTADILGFCTPEQALEVAEAVVITQRDNGNRDNRKRARCKYTVEDMGIEAFRAYVEKTLGYKLQEAKPFKFDDRGERYGWTKGTDNKNHYTLYIENGRVKDTQNFKMKTGLAEIAKIHKGDFRLTNNQGLIIGSVADEDKPSIEALLEKYGFDDLSQSGLRKNSMACVSLPTCGLALAESERYLPDLVTLIEKEFEAVGLRDKEVVIRMTGCPNGCARPYLAEIGFVGTGPNKYNLYLGAAHNGERLNKLYMESVLDADVPDILRPIIQDYAKNKQGDEHFGDFTIRAGYVNETTAGNQFHIGTGDLKAG